MGERWPLYAAAPPRRLAGEDYIPGKGDQVDCRNAFFYLTDNSSTHPACTRVWQKSV
jgi:hypothetical protein